MVLDHIRQDDKVVQNYPSYLNDESSIVTEGFADRIFFPQSISEVQEIVTYASTHKISFTISGGGTGISGGRVPYQGWIIATDEMTTISHDGAISWTDKESGATFSYILKEIDQDQAQITVPIAMPLKALQNLCHELNWFYPPDPTERSAFIGGNVATNASGARSFKFGTTRDWTESIKVILPQGELIELRRDGYDRHELDTDRIILQTPDRLVEIPRPSYSLPATDKNVAGPVITDESQPIDLFIGTGGMFGLITEVTLNLIRPPASQISLFVFTESTEQAVDIIKLCQDRRATQTDPIPMSVEYLGPRAVGIMRDHDPQIPESAGALVMIEQDSQSDDEMMDYLEFWWDRLKGKGVIDTQVAQSRQEIEHHKFLRHKVPETVNATVKSYGQAKLGTDYAVPAKHFPELFAFALEQGRKFEKYQEERKPLGANFGFAFWAHAGDSHIHLNLLPRDDEEDAFAKKLITEVLETVVEMNGSIAAEHGLGKKTFNGKPALVYQYGQEGLEQIRQMKLAIDPEQLLNPGNLI